MDQERTENYRKNSASSHLTVPAAVHQRVNHRPRASPMEPGNVITAPPMALVHLLKDVSRTLWRIEVWKSKKLLNAPVSKQARKQANAPRASHWIYPENVVPRWQAHRTEQHGDWLAARTRSARITTAHLKMSA